ncbi:hypothetical protein [Sphingomonas sp. T9W2]|uniref:hypothetical protein n=1 Tax=Sphingomonas sp. T9W2 TaxID=3143183 RepID=UPI0031F52833
MRTFIAFPHAVIAATTAARLHGVRQQRKDTRSVRQDSSLLCAGRAQRRWVSKNNLLSRPNITLFERAKKLRTIAASRLWINRDCLFN